MTIFFSRSLAPPSATPGLDVELRELLSPTEARVIGELRQNPEFWIERTGSDPIDSGCVSGRCIGALTRVSLHPSPPGSSPETRAGDKGHGGIRGRSTWVTDAPCRGSARAGRWSSAVEHPPHAHLTRRRRLQAMPELRHPTGLVQCRFPEVLSAETAPPVRWTTPRGSCGAHSKIGPIGFPVFMQRPSPETARRAVIRG